MRSEVLAAIVTREDLVTFVSILVSIFVALLAVPYAERWQRRRRSGEDYQYGLHLMQALEDLETNGHMAQQYTGEDQRVRVHSWSVVLEEATDRINSSTDSPDYKKTDKEHSRQLREACFYLFKHRGVLPKDPSRLPTDTKSTDRYAWAEVAQQSWRISAVGLKVLQRTMERDSKDEQYAAFERFYRWGDIPSPRAGEEHGHHHHEYLEHILPAPAQSPSEQRTVRGDFVVRADDERSVGFLIRARVLFKGRDETMFRFVECPPDESSPRIVTAPRDVHETVDKAWPPDGLGASRPKAYKILAGRGDAAGEGEGEAEAEENRYDISTLHYLAWNCCRDDIARVWSSGIEELALSFDVPVPLSDARDLLEEFGEGLYDEQAAALNRSYPQHIVDAVRATMSNDRLGKAQRCKELCDLVGEHDLARMSLPSIQASINPDDVELDAWIAFLPTASVRRSNGSGPDGVR